MALQAPLPYREPVQSPDLDAALLAVPTRNHLNWIISASEAALGENVDLRDEIERLLAVLVASLIFVGWEIRQNTQAVRATTTQNISDQNVTLALTTMTSGIPEILARLEGGLGVSELDPATSYRLDYFYQANLRITENRFRQVGLGSIQNVAFGQLGAVGAVYRTPFFQDWWSANWEKYAPDFVAHMNGQYGLRSAP
jgi:hypothetical protein